jgi:fumarate reductase flavoprotein subunit
LRESGDIPLQSDVIVLGAGMAGHCAALAAAESGAKVLLLEKASQPGGSSAIAGGTFAFAGTELQKEAGYEDSPEAYRQTLMTTGKDRNPELVNAFINEQLNTYEFLKAHGVKFQLDDSVDKRWHSTGTGRAITNLHMAARNNPNIQFFSKTAAKRLHREEQNRRVNSVYVDFGDRETLVNATRGIVIATGGFSRSRELLSTYAPELVDGIKHGGAANTGDGLMMAADLGASQTGLGYITGSFGGAIRNYPNTNQRSNEIPPLLFSFLVGGIMVNQNGKRFVNEGQSYKSLSPAGMEQPGGIGFQIFDQKLMDKSLEDTSVNNYKEGLVAGYIKTADTIADLASAMSLDPAVLTATINRYNADVKNGNDTEFGRTSNLVTIDHAPFYIAATANAITSTFGGITIDETTAVIDWFGEPIEGLFAAGEVIGGFHGSLYYSASSLASSAAFGIRAGKAAAGTSNSG